MDKKQIEVEVYPQTPCVAFTNAIYMALRRE